MPSPTTPIVNAGLLYVNGLNLTRASASTITAAAGAARDSTNVNDIVLSATATFDGTTVGANGMDVAVIVLSTLYKLYVIGDSNGYNDTALLGSLASSSTPTLPAGYDMYRRIGFFLTDGSADILQFWQFGEGQTRAMYYDVGISELSGGSSTTYAEVNLATSIPAIATQGIFDISYTPNSATNDAQFLPYGSSATNGIVRFGCGVAAEQTGQVVLPVTLKAGVPTIQYKVETSDALTLLCTGYYDYLT